VPPARPCRPAERERLQPQGPAGHLRGEPGHRQRVARPFRGVRRRWAGQPVQGGSPVHLHGGRHPAPQGLHRRGAAPPQAGAGKARKPDRQDILHGDRQAGD
jgi:hypothetical protein